MDDGIIVEKGLPREVLAEPKHWRTQDFLSKVLCARRDAAAAGGRVTRFAGTNPR
jgi:ABC-type antimicrobial peptide transport system ATPase subunit